MVGLDKDPPATLVERESQAKNINSNREKDEEEEERSVNGEDSPSSSPTPQLLMDSLTASLKKVSAIIHSYHIVEILRGKL